MVLITGYQKKEKDEKEFFLLELQGDVEIVISEATGLPYATMRKTLMSSTFDENMCKALVGKELAGQILKVETDEYEYTVQATGEVKTLNYRYLYSIDGQQTAEQAVFS